MALKNMFRGQASLEKDIEDKRKAGKPFEADEMDSAHQAALQALMGREAAQRKSAPSDPLDEEIKRRKGLK